MWASRGIHPPSAGSAPLASGKSYNRLTGGSLRCLLTSAAEELVGRSLAASTSKAPCNAIIAPLRRRSSGGQGDRRAVGGRVAIIRSKGNSVPASDRPFHAEQTPVTLWLWQPDPQSLDAPHPAEEHEADRLERTLRAMEREVQRLIDAYQASVIELPELRDRRYQIEDRGQMLRARLGESGVNARNGSRKSACSRAWTRSAPVFRRPSSNHLLRSSARCFGWSSIGSSSRTPGWSSATSCPPAPQGNRLNRDEMPHWQDGCLRPGRPRWSQSGKLLTSLPFSA